ncbi:MAG: hypothetical protein RIR91_1600, partial [Verrucomicrobiota bacterium]
MALINRNRLFVDVELNRAYSQFGSFSTAPQPFFIQGDQCPVEISLVRQTGVQGNPFEQVPFDYYSSCELKIGTIATGIATTASGSVVSSPNVNVTAILPYAANSWQVYRIEISPYPLGGFFTLTDGANYTQPIPVSATALELQNFIAAWGSTYSSSSVKVE